MKKFWELFAGLDRAYGIYRIEDENSKGKKKGQAQTLQRPVTPELWAQHLAGEIQLGIVPIRDDATCVFGAIDIDDYKLDHGALEAKINKLKLPLTMVRSKSGGAHLYLFMAKPIDAQTIRETLCDWAAALGYANVEVFPKQNRLHSTSDTGNWINMPYCGGDASDRHAIVAGKKLSVDEFLKYATDKAVHSKKLKAQEEEAPDLLLEGPNCLVTLAVQGIPEGNRNTTLFNLGVYCRRRYQDDWEPHLKELNNQYIVPPLPDSEVNQIIAHLARKEYSYTCKDKPLSGVCMKHSCLKKKYGIGPVDAQAYFGIDLKNVIRLETETPIYYADFNGKRISFEAEDLNSQSKFRELLIRQVNECLIVMSSRQWNEFVTMLCNRAEIIEAPQETKANAEMIAWLEEFCTEQIPAQDWSDVIDGMVLEEDNGMHFRPNKFVSFISKEHRQKITVEAAYKKLQGSGISSAELEIDGKKYKVWSIPAYKKPKRKPKGDM